METWITTRGAPRVVWCARKEEERRGWGGRRTSALMQSKLPKEQLISSGVTAPSPSVRSGLAFASRSSMATCAWPFWHAA